MVQEQDSCWRQQADMPAKVRRRVLSALPFPSRRLQLADMDPLLLFQERFAIFELILRQHTSSLNKWAQLLLRRPNLGVQTAVPLVAGGGASGVLQGLRLEAEKHELLRTAKPEKLMAEAARRERCAFMLSQYMCLCVFTICGYSLFSRQKGIKMLKHPGLSSLTLSGADSSI